MKKILFNPIFIFIIIQIAWIGLLILWIYWYVDKHLLLKELALKYHPILLEKSFSGSWLILLEGAFLMLLILYGITILFTLYIKTQNLTQLQNNFIASVTHELKSPLASIQLYLETMKYRELSPKDRMNFIDYMLKDTHRLSELINNILKANQFEKKVIKYNFIETDIKIFIEKYFEQQHILPKECYKITIKENNDFKCMIDQETMTYVLNNIIDNAIKYTTKKLFLEVRLYSDNKNCYLEFKDNGIGIDKKYHKKIFKKFFRIGDELLRTNKGTGLGLYLVYKIIKAHKGNISVLSDGKNGSTFKIVIPKSKRKIKLIRKEI